ncbi:MAG TPA: hypothetical protein VMG12_40635 [Polyangiaceae bacterium]|nr:hypothetical protein [Polyangiaceae bacterium]
MLLVRSVSRYLLATRRRVRARTRALRAGALLAAALALLGSPRALARDDLPLRWTSPAGCPDASAVMHSLGELMDVSSARWDRYRSIRGRLAREPDGAHELELEFEGAARTRVRRFRTRDCADGADLAAAALALALDPRSDELLDDTTSGETAAGDGSAPEQRAADPSVPDPASTEAPPPEPTLDSAQPSEADAGSDAARAADASEASAPLEIDLGLGGVLDPNGLGAVGFGGSAWGGVRRERLSFSLHADWMPRASLELGTRAVHVGLAAAGLRVCQGFGPALALCPEFEAGVSYASGTQLDNGRSARDPWLAPGFSVELRAPVAGALSVVSRFALLVPLARTEYLVNEGELLHRTPPVVLRLSLGLEQSLP